jgi:hypothetical protein
MNPFEVATRLQDIAEHPETLPEESQACRSAAHQVLEKALGPNAVLTPLSAIDDFVWGLLGQTHRSTG